MPHSNISFLLAKSKTLHILNCHSSNKICFRDLALKLVIQVFASVCYLKMEKSSDVIRTQFSLLIITTSHYFFFYISSWYTTPTFHTHPSVLPPLPLFQPIRKSSILLRKLVASFVKMKECKNDSSVILLSKKCL